MSVSDTSVGPTVLDRGIFQDSWLIEPLDFEEQAIVRFDLKRLDLDNGQPKGQNIERKPL